jgi:predicted amidohydrolase
VTRTALRVAAAQPLLVGGDLAGNAVRHAAAVVEGRSRLTVFPELSLSGYDFGVPPLDVDDLEVLEPIRQACRVAGSTALLGAPVRDRDGRSYLSCLAVDADGVRLAYRKMCLGGAEVEHFTPGSEPASITLDGWRVGLGICKDTGEADQIDATAALGIDLYAAGLVHHDHELGEQDARGRRISQGHRIYVVFASFAGSTGEGYERAAGTSTIWAPTGEPVARASSRTGDLAVAVLPPT